MSQSHWVLAEGRAQRMLDVNRDVDYVISHLVQHTCIFSLKFTHTHTGFKDHPSPHSPRTNHTTEIMDHMSRHTGAAEKA